MDGWINLVSNLCIGYESRSFVWVTFELKLKFVAKKLQKYLKWNIFVDEKDISQAISSVTIFGENSPHWKNVKSIWQKLKG